MIEITRNDIAKIGDIAKHCDLDKLNIAIQEAEKFDMRELFCDFWTDISQNSEEEAYQDLINGSTYEGCNGLTSHDGIKLMFSYYAYGRYLLINNFNDTPNGMVDKSNDFSMPKSFKDIRSFADRYRTMGYEEFQRITAYLCINKDEFVNFDSNKYCKPCGCNGRCGSKTKAKGYGYSGSIISKHY